MTFSSAIPFRTPCIPPELFHFHSMNMAGGVHTSLSMCLIFCGHETKKPTEKKNCYISKNSRLQKICNISKRKPTIYFKRFLRGLAQCLSD